MNTKISASKPEAWFPSLPTPSRSPLVELTTSVFGQLFELSFATFNKNMARDASMLQSLAEVRDLSSFVEQQQQFAQAFWRDQEDAFEAAAAIVKTGFEEAQTLMDGEPKHAAVKNVAPRNVEPRTSAAVAAAPVATHENVTPIKAARSTFELYLDKAGEYRFRLKAVDGRVLLSSEGYKARSSALKGVASVQKNASNAARYHTQASASGQPTFNLKAGNHQVIGSSRMFKSDDEMQAGIEAVQRTAGLAEVEDQT